MFSKRKTNDEKRWVNRLTQILWGLMLEDDSRNLLLKKDKKQVVLIGLVKKGK